MILCRGEQRAILNCLRDIFTQIEKIPPRGPIHPCMKKKSFFFFLFIYRYSDDPSCYAENQIQRYGKKNILLLYVNRVNIILQVALHMMIVVYMVIDELAVVVMVVDIITTIIGK